MTSRCPEEQLGSSPIGSLLGCSWELAQMILEKLSYREVSKFRLVCRTWADVGANILEKRRRLHYITIHPHYVPTTKGKIAIEASPSSLFEGFFEHIVSKPRYCLAFCNFNLECRTDIFSVEGRTGNLTLHQLLRESLPPSCDIGLVSATGIIGTVEDDYQGHLLESAKTLNREILSFLNGEEKDGREQRLLQRVKKAEETNNCTRAGSKECDQSCHTEGAANQSSNGSRKKSGRSAVGYSIEVELGNHAVMEDAVSLVVIPNHPGVQLKFFNVCTTQFYADFRNNVTPDNLIISTEEFNQLTSLTCNDRMESLLLFDTCFDEDFTEAFVEAALVRENYKVALGGGVADYLHAGAKTDSNSPPDHTFGVAVCGPNVKAASIVIPRTVRTSKHLVKSMQQLKSCGLPEEQSVAFMFACYGRGSCFYQRHSMPKTNFENLETKAFRRFFPNTPIFGFFGRGEMGIFHLPKFSGLGRDDDDDDGETSPKKRKTKSFHQYTTVIVLLSFL